MDELHTLTWPVARLGELIEAVARYRGLPLSDRQTPTPPADLAQADVEKLGAWIEATAAWLGLEAELVEVPYAEVARLVRGAGPAILRLPAKGKPCFLALLGGRRMVAVLGPDLAVHWLRPEAIRAALCQDLGPRCGPKRTGCSTSAAEESPVLEAHDLAFRYRSRGEPVLRGGADPAGRPLGRGQVHPGHPPHGATPA